MSDDLGRADVQAARGKAAVAGTEQGAVTIESHPTAGPIHSLQITGPTPFNGMLDYVVTSDDQSGPIDMYVLLPTNLDPSTHYQVLYVLPVDIPDAAGIEQGLALDLANKYNIILVSPQFILYPWYADGNVVPTPPALPPVLYDSYIPDVIVPFIDSTYPTLATPAGRLLVGYSKSGYGAFIQLIHHPDVFGRAGSWDGDVATTNRPEFYCTDPYFTANYYLPTQWMNQAETFAGLPARVALEGYWYFQSDTANMDALLTGLGIAHYYNNKLVVNHAWNSGWLEPMVQVLLAPDMTAGCLSETAPCAVTDPCHAGSCNLTTAMCDNPAAADGTVCDDGNPCTLTDVCSAGACVPGTPVVCTPSDACHAAGTCDPSTGLCSNPVATCAPSSTGACTTPTDGTVCTGGVCSGGECVSSPGDAGGGGAAASSSSDAGAGVSSSAGAGSSSGAGAGSSSGVGASSSSSSGSTGGRHTGGCGVSGQPAGDALWIALGLSLATRRRRSAGGRKR